MTVIELADDSMFVDHLTEAGQRLAVVDFSATWCGPCNAIAPFYKQLSTKYPNVMFLKVDVDKCPGTAAAYSVSAMPTFVFFRARVELDRMRGADRVQLENRVKQLSVAAPASGESSDASTIATESSTNIPGVGSEFMDLVSLINKSQSECLNQSDDHTWESALVPSTNVYLESDVDEQLLLHVSFQQSVKLHSLIIQGPPDNGPKDVKLFINQTRTLDFDTAERNQPMQMFELKPEDISDNNLIKLRFVKFQSVQNITFFFANNQSSSETTRINYIRFIGAPQNVTNMNEFKRVSGQAGEAHG